MFLKCKSLVFFGLLLSGNMEEIIILGSQVTALQVCMCGGGILLK